jgi:hypothetical protein
MKILCRVVTPAYMVSIDIPCEDNILSERIFFFLHYICYYWKQNRIAFSLVEISKNEEKKEDLLAFNTSKLLQYNIRRDQLTIHDLIWWTRNTRNYNKYLSCDKNINHS